MPVYKDKAALKKLPREKEEKQIAREENKDAYAIDDFFKEAFEQYAKDNPPVFDQEGPMMGRSAILAHADSMRTDTLSHEERTEPHERLVLLTDGRESAAELFSKSRIDYLREPADKEPKLALLDDKNQFKGQMPIHVYMSYMSVDKLIDMVNDENLSMTHSAIPEAVYGRIEDGDEKGEYAYAGSLIGLNGSAELTVHRFLNTDEAAIDIAKESGERNADEAEILEEYYDTRSAMDIEEDAYWDDPNIEPADMLGGF